MGTGLFKRVIVLLMVGVLSFPSSFAFAVEQHVNSDSVSMGFTSEMTNDNAEFDQAVTDDHDAESADQIEREPPVEGADDEIASENPDDGASTHDQILENGSDTEFIDAATLDYDNSASGYKENSWRYIDGVPQRIGDAADYRTSANLPSGAKAFGIDVSSHQGVIDWARVKRSGVDFAILRCGYARGEMDSRFIQNVKGCKENGIPFGIYLYSYAWDAASALSEAEGVLRILAQAGLKPSDLTLPIYYDIENTVGKKDHPDFGKPAGVDDNNQYRVIRGGAPTFAAMAKSFCGKIMSSGYRVGVYTSLNWWRTYLTDPCFDSWDRWVAQYYHECTYQGDYSMWQYTSSASVPGISGSVDANYYYGNLLDADDGLLHVDYRAHTAKYGWLPTVSDGAMAGTKGEFLRMEALDLSLRNAPEGSSIRADALVEGEGWQGWREGSVGTTGRYLEMQAVKVELTGPVAEGYDVWYRAQCEHYGWMGWAKNGDPVGNEGYGYRLEAVQVLLLPKGSQAPGPTDNSFMRDEEPHVDYRAHTAKYGWLPTVSDGAMAGTKGEGLRLEAFTISSRVSGVEVQARSYVSGLGWQEWSRSGSVCGTTGQSRALEAIELKLDGPNAASYDVWYRVQMQTYGWLGWTKSGFIAGAAGLGKNIEAISVVLLPAGSSAPGSTHLPSLEKQSIEYAALSFSDGSWGDLVCDGALAGTAGKSLPMYAFKVSVNPVGMQGGVRYSAHTATYGWLPDVANGAVAGRPGNSKQIEALRISLTGELADYFDVWYRVNIKSYGWLGWVRNGSVSGSTGCGLRAEGVQVILLPKNSPAPGSTKWGSFIGKGALPYIGYQNPSSYYQLSNRTVSIRNMGSGTFGYATPSRLSYNATRNEAVNHMVTRAIEYLGTPYIWNYASAPGVGVDCAGLVMQSLYAVGMDLSPMNPWDHYYTPGHDHYANDMRANRKIKKVAFGDRQPGDLILTAGHVSIYIGNDRIIEAWPRAGVRYQSVYSTTPILAVGRPIV